MRRFADPTQKGPTLMRGAHTQHTMHLMTGRLVLLLLGIDLIGVDELVQQLVDTDEVYPEEQED